MVHKVGCGFTGRHHTDKSREKIRKANIGKQPWLGRKHTPETIEKMKLSHAGQHISKEHLRKLNEGRRNTPVTDEECKRSSETHKGKTVSEKTRKKISESRIGKFAGSECYLWKGGISFEPYPPTFNRSFKRAVRILHDNRCFLCKESEEKLNERLSIHHFDYDKKLFNVIPLCHRDHGRTTSGDREYWKDYFFEMMEFFGRYDGAALC